MTADELGGGVDHDVGAPLQRPAEVGGGEGVVDDQRQLMLAGYRSDRLDVQHVPAGVADRLTEECLGVGTDRLAPRLGIVGVDPGQLDGHLAQHVLELIHGSAIEGGRGDDVITRLEQREQRRGLSGDAAGEGHRAGPALEAGDALLKHRDGRVHDP